MPRDDRGIMVQLDSGAAAMRWREPVLRRKGRWGRRVARAVKFSWEYAAAAVGLVVSSPLFVLCYFLIRRDGGPMLYAHERIGRNGRPFRCLKFRTMVVGADQRLQEYLAANPEAAAEWATYQKLKNDPRITPIGRFLRRTRLDEIPQFINVLKGEMALIGPRPVTAEELRRYGRYQRLLKAVRPGITGLWQVSAGHKTDYNERVAIDIHYIRHWSLLLDIVIVWKTICEILIHRNGL